MSYVIQSSPEFAKGEIALLSHSLNIADNGLVTCDMNFACLATELFVEANLAKFRAGATPPVPLPTDVKFAGLQNGNVFLASSSHTIQNGICNIVANYVGAASPVRFTTSVSFYPEEFTGTVVQYLDLGANTAKVEVSCPVFASFTQAATTTEFATISGAPPAGPPPNEMPRIQTQCSGKTKGAKTSARVSYDFVDSRRNIGPVSIVQRLSKWVISIA
jgi:hypothetical protein